MMGWGVVCDITLQVNAPQQARQCMAAAQSVVGKDGMRTGTQIMTMGGEDFSYFLAERPGVSRAMSACHECLP